MSHDADAEKRAHWQQRNGQTGRSCVHCDTDERELRPYGPGGAWVCFPCATESPEREATLKGAFSALLDASTAVGPMAAIGEEAGPRPFDPREAP